MKKKKPEVKTEVFIHQFILDFGKVRRPLCQQICDFKALKAEKALDYKPGPNYSLPVSDQ